MITLYRSFTTVTFRSLPACMRSLSVWANPLGSLRRVDDVQFWIYRNRRVTAYGDVVRRVHHPHGVSAVGLDLLLPVSTDNSSSEYRTRAVLATTPFRASITTPGVLPSCFVPDPSDVASERFTPFTSTDALAVVAAVGFLFTRGTEHVLSPCFADAFMSARCAPLPLDLALPLAICATLLCALGRIAHRARAINGEEMVPLPPPPPPPPPPAKLVLAWSLGNVAETESIGRYAERTVAI
ncbi:hypothetical protein B0H17DRAFT_1052700 [Mycena rosella]|uniref:Uncharacterized protein n=1 Tax=Mycena rosella TaxID=1033263 RepID=A0AAD7DPK7_MYCRO|nr:hypothetical protein B0H17DRAFT_1052700 [Mycena rosella]